MHRPDERETKTAPDSQLSTSCSVLYILNLKPKVWLIYSRCVSNLDEKQGGWEEKSKISLKGGKISLITDSLNV